MLKYNSTKQIDIFEFTHPFETEYDKENRWLKLSKLITWDQYKEFHGYYPEVVLAENIYLTRANREFLKELGIRIIGKPLGRPPKNESY